MQIVVGSNNPVKIQASKEIFQEFFKGVKVFQMSIDPEVPSQPFSLNQIIFGAYNRAKTDTLGVLGYDGIFLYHWHRLYLYSGNCFFLFLLQLPLYGPRTLNSNNLLKVLKQTVFSSP